MKRKRVLYHITDPENVPSIMLGGLKRGGGIRSCCAVYLSEKPLSWYQNGKIILRVDISGLKEIKATTFLPDSDEVLFWGDIPAWKSTKAGLVRRIMDVTEKYAELPDRIPRKYCMMPDGCVVCDLEMCDGEPRARLVDHFRDVTKMIGEGNDAE